ncbi:MAG: MBL fold metallo-hydrolase [Gemmatimonadota bacterium]|nr:MBL fold metallo-hydrolase [Gemmatimonadota bacterium]
MQLEFVNHAGFLVETNDVVLLCDPWIEGSAFNGGWELLAPTALRDEDLHRVTHIWFSHEHPDHFSPADLKRIPEEIRSRITVLFQATEDRKLARFCEKFGFAEVREMQPHTWYPLNGSVEMLCNPLPTEWDADSWMCLRDGDRTLLNINDCGVDEPGIAQQIKDEVGAVDVLMTQFSYAAWTGNPEDSQQRGEVAKGILENIRLQIEVIQPRRVIPFASFIWFSSRAAYHLNADVNRIDRVVDFIDAQTEAEAVVLYPGDRWNVGEEHDTQRSVSRYLQDYENIPSIEALPIPRTVPETELFEASESYVARLREAVSPLLIRLDQAVDAGKELGTTGRFLRLFRNPEPGLIHVEDLDRVYAFDPVRGLRPVEVSAEACHIRTDSDSLLFALKFLWGGESLLINGRFVELRADGEDRLGATADRVFRQFRLGRSLDLGRDLSWTAAVRSAGRRLQDLFPGFEART